jgi:hypothetical protein
LTSAHKNLRVQYLYSLSCVIRMSFTWYTHTDQDAFCLLDLPNDLVSRIVSLVPSFDHGTRSSIRSSCARLRQVHDEEWKHLCINLYKLDHSKITPLLEMSIKRMSRLTSVTVSYPCRSVLMSGICTQAHLKRLFYNHTRLQSLKLNFVPGQTINSGIICLMTGLTSPSMQSSLGEKYNPSMFFSLSTLSNLTSLELSYFRDLDGPSSERMLAGLTRLTSLDLFSCKNSQYHIHTQPFHAYFSSQVSVCKHRTITMVRFEFHVYVDQSQSSSGRSEVQSFTRKEYIGPPLSPPKNTHTSLPLLHRTTTGVFRLPISRLRPCPPRMVVPGRGLQDVCPCGKFE